MSNNATTIVDNYLAYLKRNITVKQIGEVVEVTLPFWDLHRDHLQVYVQKNADNYTVSDDGYTLADMRQSGVNVESVQSGLTFTAILQSFGVTRSGNKLHIEASQDNLPRSQHNFVQAMLALNDWGSATLKKRRNQI